MTTLGKKIDQLCEWQEPGDLDVSMPEKTGSATVVHTTVPKDDRKAAKCRYLAYFCRKYIRSQTGVIIDSNNFQLNTAQESGLNTEATTVKGRFATIETLYTDAVNNDVDRLDLTLIEQKVFNNKRYLVEELGMIGLYKNRALFIWDILWGLMSVYSDFVSIIFTNSTGAESTRIKNLIFENIERRLRKIERMRYNVSARFDNDDLPPSGTGLDGHTLRIFEYPIDKPFMSGHRWANPTNDAGDIVDDAEFILTSAGLANPDMAIAEIFRPSDPLGWINVEARTFNYCDKVIHILHLEELLKHLERLHGPTDARSRLLAEVQTGYDRRVSIVSSFTNRGVLGTGRPRLDGTLNDPYFVFHDERLDSLIPGDHIILYSHPAYIGVAKEPWRLENFLVTRLKGTKIPCDLELQGHGVGPDSFDIAQKELLRNFKDNLAKAQSRIDLRVSEETQAPDTTNFNELITALTEIYGNCAPFGVHTVNETEFPMTILEIANESHNAGEPFFYDFRKSNAIETKPPKERFWGLIEFRNEYQGRGWGAFWIRWVISHHERIILSDNYEYAWNPTERPKNLPFVKGISLDGNEVRFEVDSPDSVVSIYFVTQPDRSWEKQNGNFGWTGSDSLLVEHSEIFITQLSVNTDISEIRVTLTGTWPKEAYWRPVLVTALGIEVRGELAFRWPNPGSVSQSVRGYNHFNLAYFPLFEESARGSGQYDSRIKVTVQQLQEFYRQSHPDHTINVIKPRFEDLSEGT